MGKQQYGKWKYRNTQLIFTKRSSTLYLAITSEDELAPPAECAWRLLALLELLSPPPPEEVL